MPTPGTKDNRVSLSDHEAHPLISSDTELGAEFCRLALRPALHVAGPYGIISRCGQQDPATSSLSSKSPSRGQLNRRAAKPQSANPRAGRLATEGHMANEPEFQYRTPQPDRVRRLATEARALAGEGRLREALPLIELAISIDQIGCLNEFCSFRAAICLAQGEPWPQLAIEFYNRAHAFIRHKRYTDAKTAWLEALALDGLFLWPANNYAWLLATSTEPRVRDGRESLKYALLACRQSQWNCWAFLGTLAAAYAECGDYRRAVGWQSASLRLAPPDHQPDSQLMLQHFQSGRPIVDWGMSVAAGMQDT
jgi:tetratricopeptide (TPR) repeat protein